LEKQYQGLKIVGENNGYFEKNTIEEKNIINSINESHADILLVGLGAPFQEKWIHSHRKELSSKILMGVGGLFDFYSGNIPRAPLWIRKMGLEWTYRLYQEPRRMFKRYVIGNPLFIYRVYKSQFMASKT
jgi:N-acetylglucosaminyldiphosphoundecaprenol N-acetyl-beta-D-mannosaminyltransferase